MTVDNETFLKPDTWKKAETAGLLSDDSPLQSTRRSWKPPRPDVLKGPYTTFSSGSPEPFPRVAEAFPHLTGQPGLEIKSALSEATNGQVHHSANGSSNGACCQSHREGRALTIGLVLSGGQAPGGHNVIGGLLDFLLERHPGSSLLAFKNGPKGILAKDFTEITQEMMAAFRNTGGFHMVCSGRDKLETAGDLERTAAVARELDLDGLVVVGGDDSNSNAAFLAEFFRAKGLKTGVIGVPKTIDGDLKNGQVATSFGFDTACKVYSEQIGNLMIDAASARKYYHFVRLMGRAASHIALECALQTHPQAALICEEISHCKFSLAHTVARLADIVAARAIDGRDYGVFLLPEGLIENIPEIGALLAELNELLANGVEGEQAAVLAALSPASAAVFDSLPTQLRQELLLDRDPHGNVQVARIETEKLILQLVEAELAQRKARGEFRGKFAGLTHYFGYEGRCSIPSNFDAAYCATLGYVAGVLVADGRTGLMATASGLERPCTDWSVGGCPLVDMMCVERRRGKDKLVIKKALVNLWGPAFGAYLHLRPKWALQDCFRSPGPIQFGSGPTADVANFTLALECNNGQPIYI